eukprot:PhF_6_TR17007/c0_g1_i1/m.25756/K07964/HPSE; heparanase
MFAETEEECNQHQHAPPSSQYYCSQVRPYIYGCLTKDRLRSILQFGRQTGLRIVLGINACWNRTGPDQAMNFENAGKLLQVLGAMDVDEISALDGFEFGNELLANPPEQVFGIYPTTYAKDIVTLSQMVQSVFENHTRRPFVAGPASAYNVNQFQDMMSVIANSSSSSSEVLGVMTYHQYPQCMPPETNMALD